MSSFPEVEKLYRDELGSRIIPFWLNYAPDCEAGGHFSCLTGDGSVFDTDKFLWMEGRYLWMASHIAASSSELPSDLRAKAAAEAREAVLFLLKYGRNSDGDWYFSLDRNGKALVEAYNIFSDLFVLMGLAEFLNLLRQGDQHYEEVTEAARTTWRQIVLRRHNPKGRFSKAVPGARGYQPLNWPMIMLNLTDVLMRSPLEIKDLTQTALQDMQYQAAEKILTDHIDTSAHLVRERVALDGSISSAHMEGRLINPGHGCETLSFLLKALKEQRELAPRLSEQKAIQLKMEETGSETPSALAANALEWMLDFGWDSEYGGLFYYLDAKGYPPGKLEWDMKLWWVHLESALAALRGYEATGRKKLNTYYWRIHEYMWDSFRKNDHKEWYGYLSRTAIPTHNLAGGKWKGFFHLPRSLMHMADILHELEKEKSEVHGE